VNILLVCPELASFIARDLKILRERHQVAVRFVHHANPIRFLGDLRALWNCDLLFVWFASVYTLPLLLAARLVGKRIVTVVGGYEAVNKPEINYGSARSPVLRTLVRRILALSDRVLAVSHHSQREIKENLDVAPDKTQMIYHGFEDTASCRQEHKTAIVLGVGRISEETWMRKGFRDFVLMAEQVPDIQFVHVGSLQVNVASKLGRRPPANLNLAGRLSSDQLEHYMASAKVFLQLSRHEGFGCAVAEAMLWRCIPVVSNAAALPEVVGDCGIIVDSRDPETVAEALKRALAMPDSAGERARERILSHFPYQRRRDELLKIIDTLTTQH